MIALSRFLRDSAGNFAMTFGVAMFPIIGTAALAIDYSNLSKERGAVQNSLDAAALASAKQFAKGATEEELQTYAQDYFEANLPDYINIEDVTFTFEIEETEAIGEDGQPYTQKEIALGADLDYDTVLARALGYDQISNSIGAAVAMGNITVEIALVIDNSGSMDWYNKIDDAQDTSKDLVDAIFAGAGASNKQDPVKFALVPFAASVNVGSSYDNANWMDKKGWAPVHHENLDWDTYVQPLNIQDWKKKDRGTHFTYREKIDGSWDWKTRFDVFDMLGLEWGGCVEMRPWPHNAQDTHQMINSNFNNVKNGHNGGDGLDALFVPMFAPSEPHRKYSDSGSSYDYYDWYNYGNDYLYDWTRPQASNPSVLEDIHYDTSYPAPYDNGVIQSNQNLRQDWVWRYQAAAIDSDVVEKTITGTSYGPNYSCTSNPVMELTTSKTEIKDAIDDMEARGNTNIQQGVSWGWRMLSSREPFTDGRSEDDADNRKYIIALTDGNNTYGNSSTPNESTYSAWGYGKHERMDAGLEPADLPELYQGESFSSFEDKMNVHTLQTCENAKNDGVTIFTIAFDVSDGSSVKELLEACGGSGVVDGEELLSAGVFYYDVDSGELDEAMANIAAQISDMRITR